MTTIIEFICLIVIFVSYKGDTLAASTIGQDFVFGFINNANNDEPQFAIVSNANDQSTNVTITSIFPSFRTINMIIQPNSVEKIPITPYQIQARYGDTHGSPTLVIEDKGIRIQSTLPVAVYAHNEIALSADSFTILPTIQMGTIYMAIGNVYSFDYPNVAMAAAYEDNTIITIGVQQVSLNALQVVTLAIKGVISGITITGNKPFAAFSGSILAKMRPIDQLNHIMTTLLPTTVWGTQYPLVPFANVTNQQYQIVADTFGTVVSADGRQYTLNEGEYLIINVTGTAMLTSNNPIQMVQMGQQIDNTILGGDFFLQIPSIDKWSNMSVQFQPTGYDEYNPRYYQVRIYTTLPGIGQIQMDNESISALLYRRISTTDYYFYEVKTTNATHRISVVDPNVNYSVITYAYGETLGCGFPVAYSLP